jgi:outer membrane protein
VLYFGGRFTTAPDLVLEDRLIMYRRVETKNARIPGVLTKFLRASALGAGVTLLGITCVGAQTLEETLAVAYTNNPDLRAARANLRVVDEGVPQAKAGWRPTVTSTISAGGTYVDSQTSTSSSNRGSFPRTLSLTMTQPVYRGGRTKAAVRRATSDVQAERARMFTTEQGILLNAATAYVDTIRDESVLKLQINNLARLQKQLEATRDRFAVGEVTRTDVAQAESRVARAQADRTQAEGNLVSSRVVFERIAGIVPGALTQPRMAVGLPESLEESVEYATGNNFSLVTAKFEELSAIERVTEVQGELLPTVNIVGLASHSQDSGGSSNESTSLTLEAQINIPLYQAGSVSARVRAAKEEANRRRILVESSRRAVVDNSARTYEAWTTAVARATSLSAEVDSAQIALEGVEQEATVGARTVLDVLDAEQELLDAQVGLVRAERDAFVASYQLLVSLGRLTAASLTLPVEVYDYDRHFLEVEDRFHGTDVSGNQP